MLSAQKDFASEHDSQTSEKLAKICRELSEESSSLQFYKQSVNELPLLAREDEADLLREREENLVGDARVDDVEGRERHGRVVGRNGEDVVHAGRRGGNRLGDLGLDRHGPEVDRLRVLIRRHDGEERVLVENALVDHQLARALRLGLGEIGEVLRARFVNVAVLYQDLQYLVHSSLKIMSCIIS